MPNREMIYYEELPEAEAAATTDWPWWRQQGFGSDPSSPPKVVPNSETVLQEASRIVDTERAQTHGDFSDNARTAANIYNSWRNNGDSLAASDIAAVLICLKLARQQANGEIRDHYVDIAGYVSLLARLEGIK